MKDALIATREFPQKGGAIAAIATDLGLVHASVVSRLLGGTPHAETESQFWPDAMRACLACMLGSDIKLTIRGGTIPLRLLRIEDLADINPADQRLPSRDRIAYRLIKYWFGTSHHDTVPQFFAPWSGDEIAREEDAKYIILRLALSARSEKPAMFYLISGSLQFLQAESSIEDGSFLDAAMAAAGCGARVFYIFPRMQTGIRITDAENSVQALGTKLSELRRGCPGVS